jgi:predicted nucleotidyltransferase
MVPLVEQQLDALRAACGRHGAARLELFGSAANPGTFDPQRSDVDFIVSFRPGFDLGPWLAHYFDLRDELQQILQRPVELVMESAMQNPLFRHEADRTRQLIYAIQDTQAA